MNGSPQPNIVFIIIDTCRAGTFYDLLDGGKLPNLQRLFGESIQYRQAIAPAPWTVPSHGSLFTGLYPFDHGSSATDPQFDPPNTPLASVLSAAGYATAGISANPWVSASYNFDIGFDRFKTAYDLFWEGTPTADLHDMSSRREQFQTLLGRTSVKSSLKTVGNLVYEKTLAKRSDAGARRTTSEAIGVLDDEEAPQFLFLNYMEPHLAYEPPAELAAEELPDGVTEDEVDAVNQDPWSYIAGEISMSPRDFEILRGLYRAEIRYLDSQLGRLFDSIRAQGALDETCFVIAGDHGENIGDHGLMDHQYSVHQTLIHVPLAVRPAGGTDPQRIEQPVETRLIYHTLTELGQQDGSEEEMSLLRPATLDTEPISEYPDPQPSISTLEEQGDDVDESVRRYDRSLRSIQVGNWKLIEGSDGEVTLYDLTTDSGETTPVSDVEKQEELERTLHERRGQIERATGPNGGPDQAVEGRLEDLGYI